MVDRFQTSFMTSLVKRGDVAISQTIGIKCCILDVGWGQFVFTKLIMVNMAFGAIATVCAGHKYLLRVVTNENGVASVPDTIPTHQFNSSFATGTD
jgi:hypothetical protein